MHSRVGLVMFMAFAALEALAQAPPGATFRTGVKLVQVNVIAQDKQGKPVTDLRQDEFQLLDNGSRQEIRLFLSETEKSNPPTPAPPPLAPNIFTNELPPHTGSRSGYSAIAFDTLVTENADEGQGGSGTIWAKEKALQMLHVLPADDQIAIYATGKKLEIVREFTHDRESLEQQLHQWRPPVDTPKIGTALCGDLPPHAVGDCVRQDSIRRVNGTADEIAQVAEHLAAIPGRKSLIWIAWRFPIGPAEVQKLRNADIAIYPVDAHGSTIGLKSEKAETNAPLRALAASTGGKAYFDRDDLDVAIREALDDGRVSYTLGFYPAADERAPQVHQLAVRVSRPGVVLRYRTSYQSETAAPVSTLTKADLGKLLNGPLGAAAIPVKASIERTQDRLTVSAALHVENLDLVQDQDHWTGSLEVAGRFNAADGSMTGEGFVQTMTLNLRQATYEKALREGLPYRNDLKIPKKAVELKLLFANLASGKIGSLTLPVSEITDH